MRRASYLSQAQIASNRSSDSPTLGLRDVSGCKVKRMFINARARLVLLALLLCAAQVPARQNHSADHPGDRIYLDVVVRHKAGAPMKGLQQSDFTILNNDVPQTITSFEAVDGRQARIEVILVFDAVNTGSPAAASAYEEIKRFLKSYRGRLAYPTAVAILTDKGIQSPLDFSQDGNAISSALGKRAIAGRSITDAARFEISFQAFGQIQAAERVKPGRKIVLWVSPGWPPLVGLENERDAKLRQLQEEVFRKIVEVSTQLREGQVTVFSLDPSALGDLDMGLSLDIIPTTRSPSHVRPSDKNDYVAGAYKPSDVGPGDLTLGTIATQSGGSALHPGNDLASALRKCLADAAAYYEISFDPTITTQPNEYHRLEIRVAKPDLIARTRQGFYSRPWPVEMFEAEARGLGGAGDTSPHSASTESSAAGHEPDYANAHSYVELSMAQVVERVPELKALEPAADQQELPMILQKMGERMDDFVHNIGDLIAREDLTQERLNADGKTKAKQHLQDNYLILHHGYSWGASAEYRMDDKGKRLGPSGLAQGYLGTSGHALSCIQFSTAAQSQSQSRFRYLGDEMLSSRETYVLAFAQRPGEVSFATVMAVTGAKDVEMPTQGILWVDKSNFQILRMRSDLLARNSKIELDQLTTDVTLGEVRLQDVPDPLWLPSDVDVYIEIGGQKYRNAHHYKDYRRYRVAVKIGAPQ
jgi:VWFA-related protein